MNEWMNTVIGKVKRANKWQDTTHYNTIVEPKDKTRLSEMTNAVIKIYNVCQEYEHFSNLCFYNLIL